jgi:AcrR family transcriptional regulator
MNAGRENTSETKQKIIASARRLFSRYGFDGASIRDIASESDVNLAAINYHFKNKENLFWEVIGSCYRQTELLCQKLAAESGNVEDLAMKLFDHLSIEKETVRNSMKLLLSEDMEAPEDSELVQSIKKSVGPPGGAYFAELLAREISYALSPTGVNWGVKGIFSYVLHWSMLCTTSHFRAVQKVNPLLRPEQIRWDLQQMIRSVIAHLKAHPELFGV